MKFPVNEPYNITTKFSGEHPGIDIAPVPAGSKVVIYAPENSRVIAVGNRPALEGRYLILQGSKFYYFGHFDSVSVTTGMSVTEGTPLGIMGKTGLATGVHTHFEVRNTPNGSQIDPLSIKWEDDEVSLLTSKIENEEENRQLFLAWVGRNPYPQEKGRYVGWLTVHAFNNIAQNADRLNADKMLSGYYKNGSKIPNDQEAATKLAEIKKLVG